MKSKRSTQKEPKPGYFTILEGYLRGWAPEKTYGPGVILKTTQEIVNDLEDMVDVEPRAVASVMSQVGFRAHYEIDGGPHGWMMRKSPGTTYIISPPTPEEDPEDE